MPTLSGLSTVALLAMLACPPVQAAANIAAPTGLAFSFDYEMARLVSHAIRNGQVDPKTDAAVRTLPAAAGMIKKIRLKDGDALVAHFAKLAKDPKSIAAAVLVADELDRKDGGKYALLADEVSRQLRQYVPPQFAARLKVYFVFGVKSDGFAFGEDPYNVYVNLERFSTASMQELSETVAHELFHAVQIGVMDRAPGTVAPAAAQAGAVWLNKLMHDLLQEGTAELFSHPIGKRPETAYSHYAKNRIERNASRMESIVELFENLGFRLALAPPRDEDGYDRVYSLMFLTDFDETAYDLGWVMANAIEKRDGKAAIFAMLKEAPKQFVLRYQDIARNDPGLPKFSDEFIRVVSALKDE